MQQKPPSAASVCRSQILVDAATRTYFAQTFATFDGVLYLWADSSLSLLRAIPFSSLRSSVQAAQTVETSATEFQRGRYREADLAALQEIAEERHRLGEYLQRHMQSHRQIAIALGSGETSLERKLIAMCRKVYASVKARKNLLSKVASVASLVTRLWPGKRGNSERPAAGPSPKQLSGHAPRLCVSQFLALSRTPARVSQHVC